MDLKGWLYYQKLKIKLCHFCYNGLQKKGDTNEKTIKVRNKRKIVRQRI